jgi:hypothetical protein
MPCVAPSEIPGFTQSSPFGAVAEQIITADYLRNVGRTTVFPASNKDFIDFSAGFGNSAIYAAFLGINNPKLSAIALANLSVGALLKIPDLMTHDSGIRTEFYEIKPNSITGRVDGSTKIALIEALMIFHSLVYTPGIQYSPNTRIKIFAGTPLGCKLQVFFHFQRIAPGLIVYDICAEGELEKLGLIALLAILAIILAILLRGRVPEGGFEPVPIPA